MLLRTTILISLSILTAVTVGCANSWRTGLSRLRGPGGQFEPQDALQHGADSDRYQGQSYDDILDDVEGLRNRSPEQDAALKRQLRETSGALSLTQQQQLVLLAEALSQGASATDEDPAPEAAPANQEAASLATAAPTGRSSTFRITDADELSADESPAEEAATADDSGSDPAAPTSEQAVTRLAAHSQPAPPAALDTDQQESAGESELVDEEPFRSGEWKESISASIERLEQELLWSELDDSERVRLEATLRLLYVVNNRRDKAVTPIEQLRGDERAFWKHQLYGLIVSLDAEDRHVLSRRAALALREVRTAVGHLANISSLDLRNLALCTDVQSYGLYEEFKPASFDAGQEVILYVEVENFAAEAKADGYETELQGEYTIVDSTGKQVVHKGLPLDRQACKNRRRDYFIAYRIFLPEEIAQGEYSLVLTMEDVKGHKSNQGSIEFRIR